MSAATSMKYSNREDTVYALKKECIKYNAG